MQLVLSQAGVHPGLPFWAGPFLSLIVDLMVTMGERVQAMPGVIRAIAQANYANPERGATESSRAAAISGALTPLLQKAQAAGELPERFPPAVLAELILQTYFATLQAWSLTPQLAGLPERLRLSFDALLYGIASEAGGRV